MFVLCLILSNMPVTEDSLHILKPIAVFDSLGGYFVSTDANSQTDLEGKQQENIRVLKKGTRTNSNGTLGTSPSWTYDVTS